MMNTKLFVHGNPEGHQCWGDCTDGEKRYFDTFYNNVNDAPVEFLQVDIRVEKGTPYTYYTFVRNGVLDSGGRPGGYFALTLRCDIFYKDIKNIYTLLSTAYKKSCVGIYLRESKGTSQFIISDFTKVDSKLTESLKRGVEEFIRYFSNEPDLEPIDCPVKELRQYQKINLSDCTPEIVEDLYKKSGLKVSSYYPPQEPDPKDEKIGELMNNNKEYKQQISEKKQKIDKLNTCKKRLEDQNDELKKQVSDLDRIKDELDFIKSKIGCAKQQVDNIFNDLEKGELDNNSKMEDDKFFDDKTSFSRNTAGKEHHGKTKTKKKICLFVILILTILFIIIFVILYHSPKISKQVEADEAIEVVNSKFLQFYKENQIALVLNRRKGTVLKKEGTWTFDSKFKKLNNIYVLMSQKS